MLKKNFFMLYSRIQLKSFLLFSHQGVYQNLREFVHIIFL